MIRMGEQVVLWFCFLFCILLGGISEKSFDESSSALEAENLRSLQELYDLGRLGATIPQNDAMDTFDSLGLNSSIDMAWSYLKRHRVYSTQKRVPVMITFSYPLVLPLTEFNYRRLHYLHCSLTHIYANIAYSSSIDVYLWVSSDPLSTIPSWIVEEFPHIIILPITKESWKISSSLKSYATWKHSNSFNADYYLHSRWRMTFAMEFARSMGYQYVLFTDDDTFVLNQIPFNILDDFLSNGIILGLREKTFIENSDFVTGLPEFTRYWMTIRNISEPIGPLFDHLSSRNIDGMTTLGWDRQIHPGNFVIIRLDFWFSTIVQDYLEQVLRSGADIEQRWTEQAVVNMMRLLFVPARNTFIFPSQTYQILHGKPKLHALPQLQCPNTESRLLLPYHNPREDRSLSHKKIQKLIMVEGNLSLEFIDFDWSCLKHGSQIGVSCEEDPYASLPYYISTFCQSYALPDSHCEVLREYINTNREESQ